MLAGSNALDGALASDTLAHAQEMAKASDTSRIALRAARFQGCQHLFFSFLFIQIPPQITIFFLDQISKKVDDILYVSAEYSYPFN